MGDASAATTAQSSVPSPSPDWDQLWVFVIALGVLLGGVLLWLLITARRTGASKWKYDTELKYLDDSWSFDDSWVANVTVLGGLLTGILGSSDVVTALLGKDADRSVALAVVGAAIAAALIAAGPILLLTTTKGDFFTVGGLLVASAITLSGAAGELWVVYRSGTALELGGWEDRIVFLAVAGAVLLAVYAIRAVPATIRHGTTPPKPSESETLLAAEWIVNAIKDPSTVGPAPGQSTPRRRRSAML